MVLSILTFYFGPSNTWIAAILTKCDIMGGNVRNYYTIIQGWK